MTTNEKRISELFDELTPSYGKADSVAGEMVRAVCRINYRFFNDGDRLGCGYGKETCNAAGRYLIFHGDEDIKKTVRSLWWIYDDDSYEAVLEILLGRVADFVEGNPDLRKEATEDMYDYFDKYEDYDDTDYDEDEDF